MKQECWVLLGVLLGAVCSLGCQDVAEGVHHASPADEGLVDGPTYRGEIKALVDTHCVECHQAGSIAPFPLEDYDQVKLMGVASRASIESGTMPPWMPDPDCRHFVGERLMTADERALFGEWVDHGSPRGEEFEEPEPQELKAPLDFEVTEIGVPLDPYIPNGEVTDDYRCLPLDITFDKDVFLTASRVVPGSLSLVHHVLIFGVQPSAADLLEEADAADPGPGYGCFAGTEVSTPFPIGAWVPGIDPIIMDEGTAIHIPAGSRVVMQVHYNLLSAEPIPDLTRWEVRLSEEEPENVIISRPFIHRTFLIPKDEKNSVHTKEFTNKTGDVWEVLSLGPHMHLLGTRLTVEKIHAEGEEECLLDIPRWDFNWQQNFSFLPEESIQIAPGEGLRLTCEFDNSPSNQPLIDGVQLESSDVDWGDGTLDEMCLVFISTTRKFDGVAPLCDPFNDCTSLCEGDEGFNCVVECMAQDVDCAWCLIPEIFSDGGCVDVKCTPEMEAVSDCFIDCAAAAMASGGDVVGCMNEKCPVELVDIMDCSNPILVEGECDSAMYACNVFL